MHHLISALILAALLGPRCGHADMLVASASVRPDNSLLVDILVTVSGGAAQARVTYQTPGVEPLVSRWAPVSAAVPSTITIGRLRANKTYSYTVRAIDKNGAPAGAAQGTFATGTLPAALLMNTYTLTGKTTSPLVIMVDTQPGFNGYVGLDLHSADAPQIVWYYSNAPSAASGTVQVDNVATIVADRESSFLFADSPFSPPALAADTFYRRIAPDGTILAESPEDCSLTPPTGSQTGWIWGQGNDSHEILEEGADGVAGTSLHLAKIVKDPFFDAGLAPQGTRLQSGIGIRRWDQATGKDELVWDPFNFLDPLTERTNATNSDPVINSDQQSAFPCSAHSMQIEEWMHANSLQVAPAGAILMSVRHLDTVIAISPQFDQIAWRIGRFKSDFTFPDPNDRFYHEHFVRMLDNGNLLLFDNGDGRPAAEGGQYSRALELSLDWDSMTAAKVWEYRHQVGANGGTPVYKYADKVGVAQRLDNGNTLVWFGADIDPTSLAAKKPSTFTLVEADTNSEAGALAVMDVQIPPYNGAVYRVLPLNTLFGEVPGKN